MPVTNNYTTAIRAARRLGYRVNDAYHVGDAEVPTGWHGQDDKNDVPRTTTGGATDPAGMRTQLVASFRPKSMVY